MDLTSKIGIAVSGCKNGYAVLTTDNIDSNSPLLKQGLRDQRSYMRVTEPGHDFYTMVITKEALVLSACRSSVDAVGSSGGFIAVSIFVPVSINVRNGATLLHSMLEAYWADYMHPMFGTPLRDKFEDAYKLRQILSESASSFSQAILRYRIFPSDNALPPLFMEYTSINEVDAVMANPWHKQYSQGGELIFVPRGFLNSAFVNHNLESIKRVTAQRMLPTSAIGRLLLPAGASFKVKDFMAEGKSYSSPSEVSLTPESNISFVIEMPGGNTRQYSGTVRQAIGNTIRKKGDDYEVLTPKVSVSIRLKGLSNTVTVALSNGRDISSETRHYPDGTYEFRIPCAGFPYSLVEVRNNRVVRTLVPDAFTAHSLTTPVREIDLSNTFKSRAGKVGNLPVSRTMIFIISGVAVVLIAFLIWLFLLRSPQAEEQEISSPESPTSEMQAKSESKNTETQDKDKDKEIVETKKQEYIYIILPFETLKEKINPNKEYIYILKTKSNESFEDVTACKDGKEIILRVPKGSTHSLADAVINIHTIDGSPQNSITLDKNVLPDGAYEDLAKFPANTLTNYAVKPQREDVTPEKWNEYKKFNPDGKHFDAVLTNPVVPHTSPAPPVSDVKTPPQVKQPQTKQPVKTSPTSKDDFNKTNKTPVPKTGKKQNHPLNLDEDAL